MFPFGGKIWKMEKWGSNFGYYLNWEIGNGNDIKLWENRWAGNEPLKTKFPRLFSSSVQKYMLLVHSRFWANNG